MTTLWECTRLEIGLDLYEEGLRLARQNVSCELVQGDIRNIPIPGTFELICAFDVIEHLDDDQEVLQALGKRLTPGSGYLFITVPAFMSLWSYFDEAAHHRRRYTATGLRKTLLRAGFAVEYLSYFMSPLFPILWLGRRMATLLGKSRGTHPEELVKNEFRVVPGLNGLFRCLLAMEGPLISTKIRAPWGSSLLAVAKFVEN